MAAMLKPFSDNPDLSSTIGQCAASSGASRIQQALMRSSVLGICKILDPVGLRKPSNRLSIPALMVDGIMKSKYSDAYQSLQIVLDDADRLNCIKSFRDKHLAHNLNIDLMRGPIWNDISVLIDSTGDFLDIVYQGECGRRLMIEEFLADWNKNAKFFWGTLSEGITHKFL